MKMQYDSILCDVRHIPVLVGLSLMFVWMVSVRDFHDVRAQFLCLVLVHAHVRDLFLGHVHGSHAIFK